MLNLYSRWSLWNSRVVVTRLGGAAPRECKPCRVISRTRSKHCEISGWGSAVLCGMGDWEHPQPHIRLLLVPGKLLDKAGMAAKQHGARTKLYALLCKLCLG